MRHDGYASRQSAHPQSNRRSLSSRPHFDDAIGSDGSSASPLMRLAEAVAGVSVSAQAHCQLTAAGGLSRPTFAIANISLSVRADDKGRQSALFCNVPLGMNMSWQRGCRVCCI
jgi:hypothetical protein